MFLLFRVRNDKDGGALGRTLTQPVAGEAGGNFESGGTANDSDTASITDEPG